MAKVYITEHLYPGVSLGNLLPVVQMPPVASQTVAIGGSSVQSAAFNDSTKMICVHTDAICSVEFGASPTATTNSRRLAANSTEYFQVTYGQKIAVITNT